MRMTVGRRSANGSVWAIATTAASASAAIVSTRGARRMSVEFHAWSRLCQAKLAGSDRRFRIILTFHRRAREAAEHRQLARVSQGVGQRALEEPLDRPAERLVGGKVRVEGLERGDESCCLLIPG